MVGKKSGVDPRRNRCNSSGLAVDRHFGFAKVRIAASVDFVDTAQIIGEAAIPLLICRLTLRDHIEIRALDVLRERESGGKLIGGEKSNAGRFTPPVSLICSSGRIMSATPVEALLGSAG